MKLLLLRKVVHKIPVNSVTKFFIKYIRSILKVFYQNYVNIEIYGFLMSLRAKGNLSEKRLLLSPQFFDHSERMWIKSFIKNNDVFFDVGSNIGAYSLWVASLSRSIRIESFEPDPDMIRRFRETVTRNHLNNITLNQYAIGSKNNVGILKINQTNRGENFISNETHFPNACTVKIKKLSSVIVNKGYTKISLLKIDTEGNELEALQAFFDESKESLWPESIICERKKEHRKCDSFFDNYGYELLLTTRMNGIYIRKNNVISK